MTIRFKSGAVYSENWRDHIVICEKATLFDLKALVTLRMEYIAEDDGPIPEETYKRIKSELPAYFQNHLDKDFLVYVCRDQKEIAGCCFLYISVKPANPAFPRGKTGTVLNVYTRPMYRKKGIAGKLLKMMLKEAEEMGLDFVELKATESGYPLYKSIGFEDAVSKYHPMKFVFDSGAIPR